MPDLPLPCLAMKEDAGAGTSVFERVDDHGVAELVALALDLQETIQFATAVDPIPVDLIRQVRHEHKADDVGDRDRSENDDHLPELGCSSPPGISVFRQTIPVAAGIKAGFFPWSISAAYSINVRPA